MQGPSYDVVLVGGGVSCAFTLMELISNIGIREHEGVTYKFAMIDEYGDFGCGVAYGPRSGGNARLINSLNEFLPDLLCPEFEQWFLDYINTCIVQDKVDSTSFEATFYERCGRDNLSMLEALGGSYIPRRLFGRFVESRLASLLKKHQELVSVDFIVGSVDSVQRSDGGFNLLVTSNHAHQVYARAIILGIGTAPRERIKTDVKDTHLSLFFHDAYACSLEKVISQCVSFCRGKDNVRVCVVGANASSIEIFNHFVWEESLHTTSFEWNVISPSGQFPEPFDEAADVCFVPGNLQGLVDRNFVTADEILQSFTLDFYDAQRQNCTIEETYTAFTELVGKLVSGLSYEEKYKFANFHGNEIGKHVRRCGGSYAINMNNPPDKFVVNNLEGKVAKVCVSSNQMLEVLYSLNDDVFYLKDCDIVFNCGPSRLLTNEELPKLVRSLVDDFGCKITSSRRGIIVDDHFRASEKIYVNGPLLSGNVVAEKCIWHVEHVGRIFSIATEIAPLVLSDLKNCSSC